ncbi:MAG TPA: hypothetical protein VIC84_09825, partial [Blastocatellia bacterium]
SEPSSILAHPTPRRRHCQPQATLKSRLIVLSSGILQAQASLSFTTREMAAESRFQLAASFSSF